ncbi:MULTISPECIES: flagellar hook-length control protein FliK [unclassified Variovorax]|uniref:flagellar hook-length control protein FliK n=1 Tax=unclassified Variovorax TaxID=663243 RepID=UPI002575300D|nr:MULTISPECIES: flagellar hook-length control protein FliK [unclassified Variovorax]MDM0089793.1 flagellar hook-length control protein FliK [Variovorax sp. J22G40]MDM0148541.1 flagellar hook-length control protein FliK [Variovorax sp. J2P1-31]
MAVEGLRTAAPTAAPAPARAKPSAEAADGTGFGAALAACDSEDAATVAQEAETATELAEPVKGKADDAPQTVADAPVAVEVPAGDAAWLPPAVELPRPPGAPPTPVTAPAAARGVGAVGPAESGAAARTVSALQPLATPHDAATPSVHPAPGSAAEAPTATPAAALLLQQQRIAQRDAAATAEPSTRQAATALAPQRPGAELQALPGLGLLSPEAQGLPRRWERATASAGPVAGTGPSPVAGADASNPSPFMAPVDAAAAGASLGQPGLAERMTEQVSWWMAQKTQGAELSMALDGRPVSVSLKLQGNEAQVVFRSDQPEARQMLAQALPELKQMFGSEGLLLSQASVGSQARDPQGQGGPPARPPGKGQASVGAVDALDVRPRPMALRADGSRPLDLYV